MHLHRNWLIKARSAVGVLGAIVVLGNSPVAAQRAQPDDYESLSVPGNRATKTVDLLRANDAGELRVVAHGQGQDRVRLTIYNPSKNRLNVVLPAGVVASAAAGQGRGFQSMGLGMFSTRPGGFGQFRGTSSDEALQSVAGASSTEVPEVIVPGGESLDVNVSAVCLNFGKRTPTPRDRFTLMDVDDYITDSRVRKALRSLCALGTSQGVAQAVMWRVCNDLTFEMMTSQAGKQVNEQEIALAARFIEALDRSPPSVLVEACTLTEYRVFVRFQGEGALANDAYRLNAQIGKLRLLGLPVRAVLDGEVPSAPAAVLIKVMLSEAKPDGITGRIFVSYSSVDGQWSPLGKSGFNDTRSIDLLDVKEISQIIDRELGQTFVSIKPARRVVGSTMIKVDNHLPFTLANVVVKAGVSAGSPSLLFQGVGVGPGRSSLLAIQAASATIERVEVNGL
jgi:hypothetical protein